MGHMNPSHHPRPIPPLPLPAALGLALTLLLWSTFIQAQPAANALDAPPAASCRPDGTPEQVNACAYAGYLRAQTELDARLPAWLRQQPVERRSALQAEQRAWAFKRDAECRDLAMDAALPQAAAGEFHGCRKQRTLERLAALR